MEGRGEKDNQKKLKTSQSKNLNGAGHVAWW